MTMMNEDTTKISPEEEARDEPACEPTEVVELEPLADEVLAELAASVEGPAGVAIQQLLEERNAAREDRLRALAEMSNNQRRAAENERRIDQSSRAGVVRGILPILDQVEMALSQDLEAVSTGQLAEGVGMARDELAKLLAEHGVERIEPSVGDPFDPMRHEAMLRQEAEDVATDHVVMVMQPGYSMGEQVLRPAKVAVAP